MPLTSIPQHVEDALQDLADALQIPESRYQAAERSYKSVGEWLHRPNSNLRNANPQVYIQGSFRLGTVIRPHSDAEDYDIDLVCELSLSKKQITQEQLKEALGAELKAYAEAHQMEEPEPGRRCWTLDYADSAQFHLDTLPALPDGTRKRLLLEQRGLSTAWSDTAIAITDNEQDQYRQRTDDWPHSNPKGYAKWFWTRMQAVYEARRKNLALAKRASVEDIPEYEIRTPLQSAIQILKRHRDGMFAERGDEKPISIILTTLAAHAYQQEPTIAGALFSILNRMDDRQFIQKQNGVTWIPNPTDPTENFADRWEKYPEREEAFYEWLDQARADFRDAAAAANREGSLDGLQHRLGGRLVETAKSQRRSSSAGTFNKLQQGASRARQLLLNPSHRQQPPWSPADGGIVKIERAIMNRDGFRPLDVSNENRELPKRASLKFEATTDVPKPFKVYWQVVNTGDEAAQARSLRGGFDEGIVTPGKLTKTESTLYRGQHTIECFIVKNGYLAARSGQFLVRIE